MGFESFRIELRGGKATHAKATESVRTLPNVRPDPDSFALPGSVNFVMNDGQHVIEIQISNDASLSISCRFMLCHPPSIDSAFLEFIRVLMAALGMEAINREEVEPGHVDSYSLRDFAEFRTAVTRCIARRRSEWIAAFGSEQLAGSSKEAYEKIIIPRCQPIGSELKTSAMH